MARSASASREWGDGRPGCWAFTAGQVFAFGNLGRQAKELWRPLPQEAPSLRWVARRYRRMPLLNGPNALADALRLNGIQLLIANYSVSALGQFQTAWRYLDAPLILINGAVAKVFFQKLSTIEPGQMRPLVRVTIKRAVLIGIVPFALIYVLSPWLFPFLLGARWADSGSFARALTPWLFMLLITSPISNLFVVTEHQDWMLGFRPALHRRAPGLAALVAAGGHAHLLRAGSHDGGSAGAQRFAGRLRGQAVRRTRVRPDRKETRT